MSKFEQTAGGTASVSSITDASKAPASLHSAEQSGAQPKGSGKLYSAMDPATGARVLLPVGQYFDRAGALDSDDDVRAGADSPLPGGPRVDLALTAIGDVHQLACFLVPLLAKLEADPETHAATCIAARIECLASGALAALGDEMERVDDVRQRTFSYAPRQESEAGDE